MYSHARMRSEENTSELFTAILIIILLYLKKRLVTGLILSCILNACQSFLGWMRPKILPANYPMAVLSKAYLSALPTRAETRPNFNNFGTFSMMLDYFGDRYPNQFRVGISVYGVRQRHAALRHGIAIPETDRDDGLMCVVLHPADVETVMKSEWGQRHRLAGTHVSQSFRDILPNHFHRAEGLPPLPEGLAFIYPPTNEKDLYVIATIMGAAASFGAEGGYWLLEQDDGGMMAWGEGEVLQVGSSSWPTDLSVFLLFLLRLAWSGFMMLVDLPDRVIDLVCSSFGIRRTRRGILFPI